MDEISKINVAGTEYSLQDTMAREAIAALENVGNAEGATVEIGTVTTGAAGSNAAVTNVGTPSAAMFNFVIPRGDKGEKGDKGDPSTGANIPVGTQGSDSLALGSGTNASGSEAVAVGGRGTRALATQSVALGVLANANGEKATALGSMANASGRNSVAVGYFSRASADDSIAISPYGAEASGDQSIAIGYTAATGSSGYGGIAIGSFAEALGFYSTAIGSGAKTSASDDNVFQLGNASLSALRCKVNVTVTSDERDKTDIEQVNDGLDFINRLKPITYVSNPRASYMPEDKDLSEDERENKRLYGLCEYDREAHAQGMKKGQRRRVGLSAQQIQEALTAVYGTTDYANLVNDNLFDVDDVPEGIENQLTVAYSEFVPFLVSAVQGLTQKVQELEVRLSV